MIKRDKSLEYHSKDRPGKIELRATKPCLTPWDMSLAYMPGAGFAVEEICRDSATAFELTSKGNLVAAITNGSAVRGMGDVGAAAAKPMQEGVAVLFKRLADIDVFDLELDTRAPDRCLRCGAAGNRLHSHVAETWGQNGKSAGLRPQRASASR
jgi:malate dehydrogenase (oxaloacetate-decarboxylating)(NADP+)